MTRKDYTALAADLKFINDKINEGNPDGMDVFGMTVGVIMAAMQRENGRFDRARFLAAVGL